MREVAVIFRRELKSYFVSPIAYVFGVLFLAVLMLLALVLRLNGGVPLESGAPANMQNFFWLLPIVFLFFLPGLTMRLWAEERRSGTLELLMTFPVRIGQLISGKFLAALAFLAAMLALTLVLPLTLSLYASLDWWPVISAYVATILLASAYIAAGMFWSAMTRDQIVALLLALVTLLVFYTLGYPGVLYYLAGSFPSWLLDLMTAVSPYNYFDSITRGVLDTRDLIYFACFCGFFLYANALVLHARRQKG